MTTSEIATLPGYEEFAPWLLVEKRGGKSGTWRRSV